jgi:DNA polymerase III sliding clamp (beta) subunit (PCNA family)
MLKDVKFVQGGVARKDFVQSLQHFRIENKTIKGFNGMIGLCSPIDLDLDITPKADTFAKAIQTCQDTIAMHVTAGGKLSVKSGKFKALVECIAKEEYPEISPEGQFVQITSPMLPALKALHPFISDDASRPWSRGILFKGKSAYATNNIVLVERWLGTDFPVQVNIPRDAINELLRINEEPTQVQVTENRITFHFEGERWLCSQTFSTEWPDLAKVLNRESNPQPCPEGLFDALQDLSPFTDKLERVYFKPEGAISTHISEDEGATVELESLSGLSGCYNQKHLLLLEGVADKIDFSTYPQPCIFFGDKIRGAIIGMRL